jgi:hypothetical protein
MIITICSGGNAVSAQHKTCNQMPQPLQHN